MCKKLRAVKQIASFLTHSFLEGVKKGKQNLRFKFGIWVPPPIVSVNPDNVCFQSDNCCQ